MSGRSARLALAAAGAWLAAGNAGWGLFHHAPAPPAVLIPQPAIVLADDSAALAPMTPPEQLTPMPLGPLPVFPLPAAAPPPRPFEVRNPRPRPAAAAAGPPPPPPQLTISLNPAQQQAYRRNTMAVLGRTRSDLRRLYQRRGLSAEAAATRAQADEYVAQAQQALTQGDLIRAQALARKAETLTRFLLGQ